MPTASTPLQPWPLAIPAMTAVSALGTGLAAQRRALHAGRGGLAPSSLVTLPKPAWTGEVAGVEAIALPAGLTRFACRNNQLAELALRQDGFAAAVSAAAARFGADRIAVVLGTSTGGIARTEAAYRARASQDAPLPAAFDYDHTHDLQALPRYVRARLGLAGPAFAVSTACTSATRSFLDAAALIATGLVDAAVVGGVDTLCGMTLLGFNALELLSEGQCRPCAGDRDGICIGEAAGFALLQRPAAGDGGPFLLGVGASSDGHHMSSPHPDGLGAVVAMRAALQAAGLAPAEIDYINLHGTGTRANDAMEDRAVFQVFGDAVPCSSTKGYSGHTLGASGALEAAFAAICLQDGLLPACHGIAAADPEFRCDVLTAPRQGQVRRVLSNAFGFGGSNCCLVLGSAA